jgi:hypothetical protein
VCIGAYGGAYGCICVCIGAYGYLSVSRGIWVCLGAYGGVLVHMGLSKYI